MNINEVFRRLNRAIQEAKDGIQRTADDGEKIFLTGLIQGFEACMKVINDVNHTVDDSSPLRRCNGYGEQTGKCQNKVPHKFLVLFCDQCNKQRLAESNRPVYNQPKYEVVDDPIIIKFPTD